MAEKNEIKDIVDALILMKIAIESLNPDPMQTIAEHRRKQTWTFGLSVYAATVSSLVLLLEVAGFLLK